MIKAVFFRKNGQLSGFDLSGHAGYADRGYDIVCASVSSAAQLVMNTVTEHFKADALAEAYEDRLYLMVISSCDASFKLIESMHEHLGFIAEEFAGTISITISEV
ncbi:MAG: ribosomal-processing cysteine protease Prp [Huintestinicola sp.]